MGIKGKLLKLWNSEVGIKTTHFWGPVANWGIALSGMIDYKRHPETVSGNMTIALAIYSCLFMRFAWMVKPRNYLLLACHACNFTVQDYHLYRKAKYEYRKKNGTLTEEEIYVPSVKLVESKEE